MSPAELAELRAAIEGRHGSVYMFCRRAKISKGIVYPLLAGRYPGNPKHQVRRIREALGLVPTTEERIRAAIKAVACGRCEKSQPCHQCNRLFEAQARAVMGELVQDEFSTWVSKGASCHTGKRRFERPCAKPWPTWAMSLKRSSLLNLSGQRWSWPCISRF